MANWQAVQQGLTSGYELGRSTGGGRLGHLGGLIKQVADKLRADREAGIVMGQKRDILGMEEASKIRLLQEEARLNPKQTEWKPRTGNEALMFEKAKAGVKEWKPRTQAEAMEFETAKAGLKKGLTLSGALSILSDPMKANQLKRTYPQLYKEAEDVVKANLGEEILAGTTLSQQKTPKPKGRLPAKIVPEEDIIDTNW